MKTSDRSKQMSWLRRHLTLVAAAALALFGTAHAATITWRGTTDGAWNTTTANWAGGTTTFAAGDTVTFDDTATGTTGITTAAAVSPAGTVTVNNATKDYSFSGAGGLSGTLNLSKLGAGALTLSNSNTFTGTLTLRGGTTTFSGNALVTATTGTASNRTFSVATSAGDNATLLIRDSASFNTNIMYLGEAANATGTVLMQGGTFSSTSNGNGAAFFRIGSSGTGIWNQSGGLTMIANSLPTIGRLAGSVGQLTVSSGTFQVTGTGGSQYLQLGADGAATLTLSGNGVVETGTGSSGALRMVALSGTGSAVVNLDGGTLRTRNIYTTNAAASSTFNFNGGTLLALASSGTYMQGLTAANVKAGGAVIDTNGNAITIAQTLLDNGGGGLTKRGTGSLTLSAANTYTGTTTIASGTLSASSIVVAAGASNLGNATSAVVLGDGSNQGTLSYTGASDTFTRGLSLGAGGGALFVTQSGSTLTLQTGNITGSGTFTVGGAGNITIASQLATGAGAVVKQDAGALTFTSSGNSFGAMTLRAGTTTLSGSAIVSSTTPSSSGATLGIGTTANDNATLVIKDNATLNTNIVQLGIAASSTGTILMQGGTLSTTNNGNGNGIYFRIGGSGNGTFTQTGGLVSLDSQLPTVGRNAGSNGLLSISSGTFRLTGPGSTVSGFLAVGYSGTGTLTVSGNGVMETGTSGFGALLIVNTGSGSGVVNLDGGTIRARQVWTTGTVGSSSTFNFNGGTLVALAPNATYMQGLSTASVKAGGAIINTNGNDITIAQALLDGGGGGGLTKNGAGTLTLTGANTYTGATVVNSGSLVANGSLAGGVSVGLGGVLGGSGSVGAISGSGLVGPGNSPGILTATSVDPSSGMSFSFELTGTAPNYASPTGSVNDVLWLTGGTPFTQSLTSANTVNLYLTPAAAEAGTLTGGFFTAGQSDFVTSIQGAAFSYFVQDPAGTFSYGGQTYKTLLQYDPSKSVTISTVAANGGQVMQMVVVPEPGAVILAGVGVALAAWMAGRRTR